jgi:hypothetical protein
MSDWNGLALQSEYSTELGDTSAAFKAKVTNWINDGLFDISTRHNWPFLRVEGQKLFTASAEEQSLLVTAPTAPSVAASGSGNSLTASTYEVAITFLSTTLGVETRLGAVSSQQTVASGEQIDVTSIPISSDSDIDRRRVYYRDDTNGGDWFLHEEITDNTTTTSTITTDATGGSTTRRPPSWDYLKEIDGDPWFKSTAQRVLSNQSLQEIWRRESGNIPSGTVSFWGAVTKDKILVSPDPSAAITASFYFFKNPGRIFADRTHIPQFPFSMKAALDEYVKWRGMRYRDRDGVIGQLQIYDATITRLIKDYGKAINVVGRVRDTMGNSDGHIVN